MALKSVAQTALKLNYRFYCSKLLNLNGNKNTISNSCLGISRRFLHVCSPMLKKQEVTIIIEKGGEEITIKGKEGDSVMDAIVDNNIDIQGYGACEGTLSCSTCHIKLTQEDFQKIPVSASDEELDMLDMAPDVCPTSRLGCQVILSKELEGLRVKVPSEVKDMRDVPRVSL